MSKAADDFHLVRPSPWPFVGSISALVAAIGLVYYMHESTPWLLLAGLAGVIFTMFVWWKDVIMEAYEEDAHSVRVRVGLRLGVALFIVSEVMFFVAFFWAFFWQSGMSPITMEWPPESVETFNPWGLPFINTIILITSGVVLMWGAKGIKNGNKNQLMAGIGLAALLGFIFIGLQAYEYSVAAFSLGEDFFAEDTIYASTFYLATGFHGFHVFVGAVFLLVCFFRAKNGHFKPEAHVGFEAAEWYWHFVDVVWIFLFIFVYVVFQ